MFRILFCCVALTLVVMSGSVRGLDLLPPTESDVKVPGTDYAIRLGTTYFREPNGAISQDLVAAIVTWLSAEFSLPIIEHLRWARLSEQIFRVDKWSVCRG
jgi:hypothetical protein